MNKVLDFKSNTLLLIITFTISAKIVGLFKEILFASTFGTSKIADDYALGFAIMNWFPALLLSFLTIIFIPSIIKLISKKNIKIFKVFKKLNFSVYFLSSLAALFVCLILYTFYSFTIIDSIFFGVSCFIASLCMLEAMKLQAAKKNIYILLECLPSAMLLICLISLEKVTSLNTLIICLMLGFFLQQTVLTKYSKQIYQRRSFQQKSKITLEINKKIIYVVVLSQLLVTSSMPINFVSGSSLDGGTISSLNYSNKIAIILFTFFGTVLSRYLLPKYSYLVLEKNKKIKQEMFVDAASILVLSSIFTFLVILFSTQIIAVLFERGAFIKQDTEYVAMLLSYQALQIPIFAFGLVLIQFLIATNKQIYMSISTIIAFLFKLLTLYFFIGEYGAIAIILSDFVMYFLCSFFMILFIIDSNGNRRFTAFSKYKNT